MNIYPIHEKSMWMIGSLSHTKKRWFIEFLIHQVPKTGP